MRIKRKRAHDDNEEPKVQATSLSSSSLLSSLSHHPPFKSTPNASTQKRRRKKKKPTKKKPTKDHESSSLPSSSSSSQQKTIQGILRNISSYQANCEPILRRAPFRRLVQEIASQCTQVEDKEESKGRVRFQAQAIDALLTASESFLTDRFQQIQTLAVHAKRKTIMVHDFRTLAHLEVRSSSSSTSSVSSESASSSSSSSSTYSTPNHASSTHSHNTRLHPLLSVTSV